MNQSNAILDILTPFESITLVNGSVIHFEVMDDPEEMMSGMLEPEDWSWV